MAQTPPELSTYARDVAKHYKQRITSELNASPVQPLTHVGACQGELFILYTFVTLRSNLNLNSNSCWMHKIKRQTMAYTDIGKSSYEIPGNTF